LMILSVSTLVMIGPAPVVLGLIVPPARPICTFENTSWSNASALSVGGGSATLAHVSGWPLLPIAICAAAGCDHPETEAIPQTEPQIANRRAARARAIIDMSPPRDQFASP